MTAFRETSDAFVGSQMKSPQVSEQHERATALRAFVRPSRLRVERGVAGYLWVLIAENEPFVGKSVVLTPRADHYAHIVGLYRAMGRGWIDRSLAVTAPTAATAVSPPPRGRADANGNLIDAMARVDAACPVPPAAVSRRTRCRAAGDTGNASRPAARAHGAWILTLAASILMAGCVTLPRNGLPESLVDEAVVAGMPEGLRAAGGRIDSMFMADLVLSFAQDSRDDFTVDTDGTVHYPHLALSGGGAHGAFGAGVLSGWSSTDNRPVFKIVTGVSTGALMAPFAFLGPAHDDTLRMFYTTTNSNSIFRRLPIMRQLFSGESLADAAPLQSMIAKVVDQTLLAQVAQAHRQGRRLYVGTTDLDSQRFMVWNMGLLAASGRPGALDLFRKIMLASASIPIAFQPVLFEVDARGKRYDELHVDGAVGTNVFYSGGVFDFALARIQADEPAAREDIYIIHNGQLASTHATTSRTLGSIALRSLDAAGKSSAVGDLFRIFAVARRNDAGFYWVTMPAGISLESEEVFDPVLMGKLFELGFDMSQQETYWNSSPPGFARPGSAP